MPLTRRLPGNSGLSVTPCAAWVNEARSNSTMMPISLINRTVSTRAFTLMCRMPSSPTTAQTTNAHNHHVPAPFKKPWMVTPTRPYRLI